MKKIGFKRKLELQINWDWWKSDGFFNWYSAVFLALALITTVIILVFYPDSWKNSWWIPSFPGVLGIFYGLLYFTAER